MKNDGINIGGNANVTMGNTAVGANSSITVNTTNGDQPMGAQQLSALFDSLLEKINATQQHIPEKEDLVSSIVSLRDETKKEKPNKITLAGVGKAVMENLKYVKDVAPIAELIWQHITPLLA